MKPSLFNARGATLIVYLIQTALGLVLALPLARLIASAVSNLPDNLDALYTPGSAHLLDALRENSLAWVLAVFALFTLAALAFVTSPLVQMTWLNALARKRRLHESVSEAVRQFGPALRVSLALSPILIVSGIVTSLGVAIAGIATHSSPNERTHDLAILCSLIPGVLVFAYWSATHDLARAALTAGHVRARQATMRALRKSIFALPAYFVTVAVILAFAYLGYSLAIKLDHGGTTNSILVLLVQQTATFAAICTRALWLTTALRRTGT